MPALPEILLAHEPIKEAAASLAFSPHSSLQGASLAGGLDRMKAVAQGFPAGNLSTFNAAAVPDSLLKKADRDAVRAGIIGGPDEKERLRKGGFSTTEIRQGDAARRKAFAKEEAEAKLRAQTGKQNEGEALNSIVKNTAKTAKVIGKVFSEPVEAEEE